MAIYSLSMATTVTTTGAASGDIMAASACSPRIMECGINLGAATLSYYALGRSGNTETQTTPTTVLAENPNDPAGNSKCAVAWSPTAPTVPANFFRRIALPAVVGAGVIWTFPRGLILATSAGMLIWNTNTSSAAMNFWFVVDE